MSGLAPAALHAAGKANPNPTPQLRKSMRSVFIPVHADDTVAGARRASPPRAADATLPPIHSERKEA
jgi:hypothetical protein